MFLAVYNLLRKVPLLVDGLFTKKILFFCILHFAFYIL